MCGATVVPMQPDPTYKIIFAHRFMVEELMHWLVADVHGARELVDALDFSGMQRVQEQSVTSGAGGQHVYANDIVWRVPFHGRPEDDAGEGWLPLVVMLEFQSEVDVLMALRVRNYVDNFHMERRRGKEVGASGRLAPVLPIVLYNGESRWTAVPRVIDLVTPGAPGAPTAAGGVGLGATWRGAPLLAGDGYLLLDARRLGREYLRHDNAAALLAGMENLELETAEELFRAFHKRVNAPELQELKEVMLAWASRQARRRLGVELGDMAELNRLRDPDEIDAYYGTRVHAWKEEYRAEGRAEGIEQGIERGIERGIEQGIEQGIERGIEQGIERGIERGLERGLAAERELLCRLAARKFGTGAGERLAGVLAQVGDTNRLAQVGDWIIDCATGESLIARFGNGAGS